MPRGKKAGPPVMDYDAPAASEVENEVPHPQMTIPGAETEQPEVERVRRPRNPGAPPIKRISFTVHEDNTIAWERLRDANKEEVKKVVSGWLSDPNMLAALGVEKSAAVQIFDASWSDTIYDTVGNLEVMLAPKMFGVTLEQAGILRYSQAEKDQLREPTARVINKYLPAWLAKFEDEIRLGMLLISISFVKVQMLRAIAMMPKPSQPAQHANGKEQVKQPDFAYAPMQTEVERKIES